MVFDVERVRAEFPALSVEDEGVPRVYFDNPAGTQVPKAVLNRVTDTMAYANANLGGPFQTSVAADAVVAEAHAAVADLLGSNDPAEIVFGLNMTTLTFHISRSIGRTLREGDEIVVTRMDHDANVWPWVILAADTGARVRWLDFDPAACEFDLDDLDTLLNDRTRLVAVGYASNLTGTVHDVAGICSRARAAGAWTYIDAVQFAPHGVIDVGALGCDFLVCSAYKFFGPHQGVLWARRELIEELEPYKLRPAPSHGGARFETGTQSHEGMAGTEAAVDYLAWIGTEMGAATDLASRRERIEAGITALRSHEDALSRRLIEGLRAMTGVTIRGVSEPDALDRRVPTVAITVAGHEPADLARAMAEKSVFVWSGHNYAVEVVERLGLTDRGGVLRIGPVHYNTLDEIDRFLELLARRIG